ncbi:MAG: hypothetical protein KDA63_08830 [Planctomycetales bacterium]|nr:hypothetical protein [Planctomycetales bacterium]
MSETLRYQLVVLAVAGTVFLVNLGGARLFDEDEPKNAACGQEMFAAGEWIVPSFNGELRTDKPILLYWCMLASFHVLGVNEWSARLPSARRCWCINSAGGCFRPGRGSGRPWCWRRA